MNEYVLAGEEPVVKLEGPVREPILKLGSMVTNRLFYKVKPEDPEYWGLALLISDAEAEVALKMKRRVPRTMKDLVSLTGKSASELTPLLDHMSEVGVLEYNWENPKHEKQWVLPMFVPGSAEFANMSAPLLEKHPELGRYFERCGYLPLAGITQLVPPGGAGIGMHVIPVEKAIEHENQSIDIEHISHWMKKYDKYAASPCSCRLMCKTFEEGCGDDPADWCIAVGDMADYVVETNKGGRYISYDEAMEIFQKAEDRGYVHQITNIDGEKKIFAICNCNLNVCVALRTSQLFNTPNLSRSAYVARVNEADCVACGRCVEFCPAGAVKLGQKLCTKNGKIEYPKHPLPDKQKWGEDKWDPNYRDTNRINCYDTGTAPCKTACPAHIAVQGYLKMAAQGKFTEALALIKKENPFPAVCGAICNRRCEEACTRGTIDQAIAIDEVKKFIAQRDINAETRYIPPIVKPAVDDSPWPQKVAIIGAGPAGLSCAFFLAEKGYKPTVFEKEKRPGGMLTNGIPSFRLEKDVVDAEIEVIKAMGVEIKCGVEIGKDITIDQLRKEGYKAFYVAIGCQGGRKVGVPGEDAEGVQTGVDFLRAVNLDENGTKLAGNTVVVGGGNVAVDVARAAERCGDGKVSMFCLETRDIMPAAKDEVEEAEAEGIAVNCGWGPKEVLVENGKVKGIVFKKCLSVFDENNKFAPKYDENDTMTVECENVLLSVGQSIIWGDLLAGSKVELGRGNGAVADALTYQTAEPDIFVGGDVYTGPKFAIDAIAAGKEAAYSIHRFVQPHCTLTVGRNRRQFIELDKSNIVLSGYDTTPRQIPGIEGSAEAAAKSFRDMRKPFTEEQVKAETARCLGCGASIVDTNKCIGCGVCTTKCAFDAIKLYRENPECSNLVVSEDKVKALLPYMIKRGTKILFSKKEK
jgi:NADPH-dependent glutamate synthase beta subunit-like oxidoreductase